MIHLSGWWGGGDKGIKEKDGLRGFAKVKHVLFKFPIFSFFANKKKTRIYMICVFTNSNKEMFFCVEI